MDVGTLTPPTPPTVIAESSASTTNAHLDVEVEVVDGQEIRFCRPTEPQPDRGILLPAQYHDDSGIFYGRYYELYVFLPI